MHEEKLKQALLKYRYPLLILLLGAALMLLPGGKSASRTDESKSDAAQLQELLTAAQGVGEARVLISDSGVIIVCRGADSAAVRLDILRAVGAFTGFGSDKITILKMADP